jgi:outer membrane protein OmpA-like peptidoglycan-associated protein
MSQTIKPLLMSISAVVIASLLLLMTVIRGEAIAQTAPAAPDSVLNKAFERYTSPAAKADLAMLAGLQSKLLALNTNAVNSNDYVWVKSQRWLDVANDEYRNNNRGAVPQQALGEANRSMGLLGKAESVPAAWDTSLLDGAPMIRNDLWARIERYQPMVVDNQNPKHGAGKCAAGSIAYTQVQLAWAAWVNQSYGWRSALPYIAHAEKMLDKAEAQFKACDVIAPQAVIAAAPLIVPAAAPSPALPVLALESVPAPLAAPLAAPQALVMVALPSQIYFANNRTDIGLDGQSHLQSIAAVLKLHPSVQIIVEGYADDTGRLIKNQTLSDQRAQKTMAYLVSQGIAAQRITAKGIGTIVSDNSARRKVNPYHRRAQVLITAAKDHPIHAQLLQSQTQSVKVCANTAKCP